MRTIFARAGDRRRGPQLLSSTVRRPCMAKFVKGQRPAMRVTLLLTLALFLLGCVLALLEWRLPIVDPSGYGINFTRLSPLIILVVLVPLTLPLRHLRHPWPFWLYPVVVELMAGLLGYVLLFHILPRSEPPAVGPWGSWWVTGSSFVAIWLVSVVVAAISITASQLLWKPQLERVCHRCGYRLRGLRDERCPECGCPVTLNPRDA